MIRRLLTLQLFLAASVMAQEVAPSSQVLIATPESGIQAGRADTGLWDSIRVLDLERAQQIALSSNPSLQAAQERVEQARARVLQAQAAYLPRLDASASAAQVRLSDNAYQEALLGARQFNPQATIDDPEDYYQAGLQASWVLFDGFARRFSNASARYGRQESEAARAEARRLLLSAVASSFYGAQLARESIAIAEADEAFNRRQLQEAQARRRVGTGSLSDELNFEVRVNSAEASLISSRWAYETARIGLAALMGISDAALPAHLELARLEAESPEELQRPRPEPLVALALLHRPDMLQSDYAARRTRAGVGVARSELLPTVSAFGTVEGSRANSGRFEGDDFGDTVGVSLSYNLFSGGARLARLREAKARRREAQDNLETVRIAVTSEVRQAIAELAASQEQLVLQRRNASLVQRNRDLVEKEYAAGQISLVRLNEAQRDLTTAQSRLALARVSLRQAWHNLQTATAETLFHFSD